jgi:hypothetical protein
MHATADTTVVIFGQLVGRRVMRGVGRLMASPILRRFSGLLLTKGNSCDWRAGRA